MTECVVLVYGDDSREQQSAALLQPALEAADLRVIMHQYPPGGLNTSILEVGLDNKRFILLSTPETQADMCVLFYTLRKSSYRPLPVKCTDYQPVGLMADIGHVLISGDAGADNTRQISRILQTFSLNPDGSPIRHT